MNIKVKFMLRPTISRPVYLGIEHPSEAQDQILITVRQLRFVDMGRLPWREDGSVVYNCCWPSLAQSFSGPSQRDSWPYFTVSDSRLPELGGSGLIIYIPQWQCAPVIPPGTGFHFRRLLRLAELRWKSVSVCLLVCLYIPTSLLGNKMKKKTRQWRIFGGVVFYAVSYQRNVGN
jgi:hypothetical protein